MDKRLIILSVPNIRVARVLLNDDVLNALKGNADVVAATPFAEDQSFQNEYSPAGIGFHQINPFEPIKQPIRALYTLSELTRTIAYYRKYKRRGLQYYWSMVAKQYGNDGHDSRDPLLRRLIKGAASIIGLWRGAWRALDKIIGKTLFRSPSFEQLIQQYEHVTLVQASSWGDQDRMLSWYARHLGFRTVLVPYTTDQLWVNGYLLCDYDAVCVQGRFEDQCARNYHNLKDSSIVHLGSMWYRTVDKIRASHLELNRSFNKDKKKVVLYAGVSRAYFPRESEFQAIDALIAANQKKLLGDTKLVYRPYAMEPDERAEIVKRYGNAELIQLQWPEEACAGLYAFSGGLISAQLLEYIQNLVQADVLIMSHTTSLGLDAAYLGCGVIANFSDETGILARRETHLRFLENGTLDFAPDLPVVHTLPELVSLVEVLLNDEKATQQLAEKIVSSWDYKQTDSQELLRDAIYGKKINPQAISVEATVSL
jgi:hypothetical protein